MSRPTTSAVTERWWAKLPELYRAQDEAQAAGPDGWPLLRFMSLMGDQAGELETLLDRLQLHENPDGVYRSDLANPDLADDDWLLWIAQLVGLDVTLGSRLAESYAQLVIDYASYSDLLTANGTYLDVRRHGTQVGAGTGPDQIRQLLRDAALGRLVTSTGDWERIIQPYLTGLQRVRHERVFGGDAWHLQLETYAIETPNPAIIQAVIDRYQKAAGLVVTYDTRIGSSYQEVEAPFGTYAALEAAFATYSQITTWTP